MAEHKGKQGEWPVVKRQPDAWVTVPDVNMRTDRSVAGPLRYGTLQDGVGPRGENHPPGISDYGKDRVSPREFDPMGTSMKRYDNAERWNSPHMHGEIPPRNPRRGAGAGPRTNASGEGHD
jgi:hypothetical protein